MNPTAALQALCLPMLSGIALAAIAVPSHSDTLTEQSLETLVTTYAEYVNSACIFQHIEVVEGADSENIATATRDDSSGEWTLVVNIDPLVDAHGEDLSEEQLDDPIGEGVLAGIILHELLHYCNGDYGETYAWSCQHYRIDYTVSTILCELAMVAWGEFIESEDIDTFYLARGYCLEIRRLRGRWAPAGENLDGALNAPFTAAKCWCENHEQWNEPTPQGEDECALATPDAPTPEDGQGDPCEDGETPTYEGNPIPDCSTCDNLLW